MLWVRRCEATSIHRAMFRARKECLNEQLGNNKAYNHDNETGSIEHRRVTADQLLLATRLFALQEPLKAIWIQQVKRLDD